MFQCHTHTRYVALNVQLGVLHIAPPPTQTCVLTYFNDGLIAVVPPVVPSAAPPVVLSVRHGHRRGGACGRGWPVLVGLVTDSVHILCGQNSEAQPGSSGFQVQWPEDLVSVCRGRRVPLSVNNWDQWGTCPNCLCLLGIGTNERLESVCVLNIDLLVSYFGVRGQTNDLWAFRGLLSFSDVIWGFQKTCSSLTCFLSLEVTTPLHVYMSQKGHVNMFGSYIHIHL